MRTLHIKTAMSWIFVLPPLRFVGIRCVRVLENQQQELVHLQQEGVSTALGEKHSQKPALLLAQSLLVLLRNSHKWILMNTRNAEKKDVITFSSA